MIVKVQFSRLPGIAHGVSVYIFYLSDKHYNKTNGWTATAAGAQPQYLCCGVARFITADFGP